MEYKDDGLNLDVPNLHLLTEISLRSLPALRNMRCCLTNRYESAHQVNKHRIRSVAYALGSKPENFAIHEAVVDDALDFVARGGRWGPNLEHGASKELIERVNVEVCCCYYCGGGGGC
jgi:hypothetical protein